MNNNNILQKETVKNLIKQLRERERDGILEKNNLIFIEKLISKADSEEEAIKIAELGTIYKKTGLHFDRKLEISTDSIKVYKKNDKLSFEQGGIHHKLIIGDNYDALMNLLITHRNKIDVIYIDPPYGCDDMGEFAETNYENQITRDNLLSMLEPRLILAKQLLSEDGVIFCSIDDKNYAYLKCLFDEVFGERNF
jgi:adenine-specific DNA-methyltransferase